MSDLNLKCVRIEYNDGLPEEGNHILMPSNMTLCGMPTVDVDLKQFPILDQPALKDFRFEYEVLEWNITCHKCLEMIDILKQHRKTVN